MPKISPVIENYKLEDPLPDCAAEAAADAFDAAEHRAQCQKHERPWGYFQVLYEDAHCKVKKLVVHPGQRTSLQRHMYRTEYWVAVTPGHIILKGPEGVLDRLLYPGDCTLGAKPQLWHRFENHSETDDFIIIETQTGSYFGEDDIERKEDDYGRT